MKQNDKIDVANKWYYLLADRRKEYPLIKEFFQRNCIPYEPSWYNNILVHVGYLATLEERNRLMSFTTQKFGW